MIIFVYNNIIGNSCSGDFYFMAADKKAADKMADLYAKTHNKKVKNNRNYTIEWDKEDIKEFDIKPGFLPLNRMSLPMEK